MKLSDLFEKQEFNAEKEKSALINKLRSIKQEIKTLQQKSASTSQSGIDPRYKSQWDRLQAAKKTVERDLEQLPEREKAEKSTHEFHRNIEQQRASETSEQKKERFGKAVGQGLKATNKLRKEEGGHAGVAEKVYDYVKNATKDGSEKITAEEIAHHFNTTARSVNRWLERKEFTKVARLMGRR